MGSGVSKAAFGDRHEGAHGLSTGHHGEKRLSQRLMTRNGPSHHVQDLYWDESRTHSSASEPTPGARYAHSPIRLHCRDESLSIPPSASRTNQNPLAYLIPFLLDGIHILSFQKRHDREETYDRHKLFVLC